MSRPRVLPGILLVLAVLAGACGDDQAQLVRPGADAVHADIGELRVLTYEDDPSDDAWQDVLTPDPAVFAEGDAFREDDSRTADADEAAQVRRLFTATGTGRTLLVAANCDPCDRTTRDAELLVWELVAGDAGPAFAPMDGLASPGEPLELDVGQLFAVVRDGTAEAIEPRVVADEVNVIPVGRHGPDEGVDLRVDVFVTTAPGVASIVYGSGPDAAAYPLVVN